MPSLEENLERWDCYYDWENRGDEWSEKWGGPTAQWFGSVVPRIHSFIPTATILEIGPGFGRWTEFLKDYCEKLIVIDISKKCLEYCKQRFSKEKHIEYYLRYHDSLESIPDSSIDFVFSYDSLVHADRKEIDGYLSFLTKKLSRKGFGFIHHSNLEYYFNYYRIVLSFPYKLRKYLERVNLIDKSHWRDITMSAKTFNQMLEKHNLQCVSQEIIPWFSKRNIDCFTILSNHTLPIKESKVLFNNYFTHEIDYINKLFSLYTKPVNEDFKKKNKRGN